MKHIHYAWWVCVGCALLLFCTSGLAVNAFTVYQPYILKVNGFTNAQSSTLITIRSLFTFLSMLSAGLYYRHFSLRAGMTIAGMTVALGFLTFALAGNYAVYCAAAALVGLGYGVGTMIPIAILLDRWFLTDRTLALGACSAVTGLSTLGIPSMLTALIEEYSLRAGFLVGSAAIALLTLVSWALLRNKPAELGLAPYAHGEAAAVRRRRGGADLTKGDWAVLAPTLLLIGAVTSVGYSHLTVHMSAMGYSPHVAAFGITVSGIALMLGKIAFGWVSERAGMYAGNWIFGLILVAGLVLLCLPVKNSALLYLAMAAYGVGLSLTTVGLTAWAGDWSTEERYDSTVGRFQIGYSGGGLLFSSLPGILADRSGGSYRPAYLFFLACAVCMLLTVQFIYLRKRKGIVKP
ncbi:MAG: MFS transporter [Ruminococcaceae bacterium]|nr:MFS transporter [Oscillospiraceae bacterium]